MNHLHETIPHSTLLLCIFLDTLVTFYLFRCHRTVENSIDVFIFPRFFACQKKINEKVGKYNLINFQDISNLVLLIKVLIMKGKPVFFRISVIYCLCISLKNSLVIENFQPPDDGRSSQTQTLIAIANTFSKGKTNCFQQ